MPPQRRKKISLRRGFLKEANEYALEYRSELNLQAFDPLCPFRLAEHLAIPVTELSSVNGMPPEIVQYFHGEGMREFSAITLQSDGPKQIIYNDGCHPNRQISSVAHEIAHIVLGHPLHPPMDGSGCRNFDPVLENEANEFAYAILITPEAALNAVENFVSIEDAAQHYGVSVQLLQHRIGKTNARRWAQNRQRYRSTNFRGRV